MFGVFAVCVFFLLATPANAQYQGILINGINGTQLYDPFNVPHAQSDLQFTLQTDGNGADGAAVINGHLAYFGAGSAGRIAFVIFSTIYTVLEKP